MSKVWLVAGRNILKFNAGLIRPDIRNDISKVLDL